MTPSPKLVDNCVLYFSFRLKHTKILKKKRERIKHILFVSIFLKLQFLLDQCHIVYRRQITA